MSEAHPNNPNIQLYTSTSGVTSTQSVMKYAGGYPGFYLTKENSVLSAEAVEENMEDCCNPDSDEYITGFHINWEDESLYCDETGDKIECAYPSEY